jgi:hypothetical protein
MLRLNCAFLQGEAMGRPSVIATRIQADGNIFVGGTAMVDTDNNVSLPYLVWSSTSDEIPVLHRRRWPQHQLQIV